ncbi:MAG: hypothetical protein EOP83_24110 [Verrucomicrobiaceae bacterium]|nr:MAG: hypothetical protein EOP83_24110 [Verrucomicrobiaceae bacterium]
MTKHLDKAFGLPHLEDLLKEEGVISSTQVEAVPDNQDTAKDMIAGMQHQVQESNLLDGKHHADAMDQIFEETLRHAQNVMDTGFNIDPARAPRWFEVATGLYKTALDAKNSRRDAELKTLQVKLAKQKLELDRMNAGAGGGETVNTQGMVVEDRNEMIRRLRAEAEATKASAQAALRDPNKP